MAGVFPDAEEEWVAQQQVNYGGGGTNLTLHLFKSNTTPGDSTVAGDFTEADFTGYSSVTLIGANWVITANAPTTATYAEQTFTSTADQTLQQIYGFYLLRGASYVFGERFTNGPYSILNTDDYVAVTPALSYKKSGE